jgi:hypothetical protein
VRARDDRTEPKVLTAGVAAVFAISCVKLTDRGIWASDEMMAMVVVLEILQYERLQQLISMRGLGEVLFFPGQQNTSIRLLTATGANSGSRSRCRHLVMSDATIGSARRLPRR